jgi:hypothetical protein
VTTVHGIELPAFNIGQWKALFMDVTSTLVLFLNMPCLGPQSRFHQKFVRDVLEAFNYLLQKIPASLLWPVTSIFKTPNQLRGAIHQFVRRNIRLTIQRMGCVIMIMNSMLQNKID